MKHFVFLMFFVIISLTIKAQCDILQFSVLNADKLCRNSQVRLVNESAESNDYYWDFCPEFFSETPINQGNVIAGFEQGYGYRLVQQDGLWYGFLVSRSLDKLFRLDFGVDPENTPAVTDLGNPGGLLDAPEGIEFFKDGDNWFAFVGKGENSIGQVVKLSFGADLNNMPTATGYGTFGLGSIRIRDLSIVRQGNDIILVLLLYNTASLNRINFGNSLANSPGTNNVVPIPGAALPRGLNLLTGCNPFRAHIVCENGLVQQISFGNDILGPISVEGSFTFTSVVQPWKIKTIFSGGTYFSIVSNNNRKYSIIDFGDLSLQTAPREVLNNNDVRFIGVDVIRFEGKTLVQGGGGGSSLFSILYQNDCHLEQDYSYERNPKPISYGAAGDSQIDLIAFKNQNVVSHISQTIQIKDLNAPDIQIGFQGVCQGSDVHFYNSKNDPISSWHWDFGNGLTSGSQSPVTSYTTSGPYSVTLFAEGTNSCFNGNEIEIEIYTPPIPDFSLPSGLLCTNNEFTFSNTTPDPYNGNLSYQWYVDDNPVSTERDFQYSFTTTGPKEIRMTTSIPGCSSEFSQTTSPIEAGPAVDFSYSGNCEGEMFYFHNELTETVDNYFWNFGNGQTSTDPDPGQEFSTFGDFSVSLRATNAIGCQSVKTRTIPVHAKPLIDFTAPGPPNSCSGTVTTFQNESTVPDGSEITEWLWAFNDPNNPDPESNMNADHTFSAPGLYNISLTSTSSFGCSATQQKAITIAPSPSTDFTFSTACVELPVTFTSPAGNDINDWYWEMGTAYYKTASPNHTFRTPGTFPVYLEVTGINGCIASATRMIRVPEPLKPDFSFLKNCVDQEAVFTDITTGEDPVVSREWDFNTGETFTGSPTYHTFQNLGSKTVRLKVIAQSGCSYQITRAVEILPPPRASFSADPAAGGYPLEVEFTNTSAQATKYLWKFSDGTGATSAEVSPEYTFYGLGSYPVELTAYNNQLCENTFQTVITTVAPVQDADVEMISLSPNADGSSRLIVTIHNKGNTFLKDLPVDIDFGGRLKLRQVVGQTILPASKYNLVLSTGILDPESLRYLCVSIDLSDDISRGGNRNCLEFENTPYVFSAYPNPAKAVLNVEWIAGITKSVRISLTDALGRKVLSVETVVVNPGLNHKTMDLSGLQDGLYYLTIEDGKMNKSQRIVVSGKL